MRTRLLTLCLAGAVLLAGCSRQNADEDDSYKPHADLVKPGPERDAEIQKKIARNKALQRKLKTNDGRDAKQSDAELQRVEAEEARRMQEEARRMREMEREAEKEAQKAEKAIKSAKPKKPAPPKKAPEKKTDAK